MYVSADDLETYFGEAELVQLSNRAGGDEVDADVVAAAIADAGRFVDTFLGVRYDLPLASVPGALKRPTADIARYYLSKDGVTEAVRDRYEDATEWLARVAAGKVALDVGGSEPAPQGGGQVAYDAPERVFTRDTLRDY